MFNWAKQQLANVAGTEEPIYGPSAIQPVTEQAKTTPYTELKKEDLKWFVQGGTNVETQTFYFTADNGLLGMAQIIYSSVAGIRKTAQFNSKIIYPDHSKPNLWCSTPLENYSSTNSNYDFKATGVSFHLSDDGNSYTLKSTVNKASVVDITVTRVAPGFVVGRNGTSTFGTDRSNPWGSMRHAFWPRCSIKGTFLTQSGPVDFAGKGLYIHALQGMKPHHAAAKWDFMNFQGPKHSAVMMQFTTPPSYGSTVVNVAGIATDDGIVFAGANGKADHTEASDDGDNGWPEPKSYRCTWKGEGEGQSAVMEGSYGKRVDRVDVMAEVPGFVKTIVANAAGTKPYIYQYGPKGTLHLKNNGHDETEEGQIFSEATFISGDGKSPS